MRPTKYNKRITVQKSTPVTTATGGLKDSWTDLFDCWASVAPVKGMKRIEYGKMDFVELYEIEMRSRTTNPDGDCKVIYHGNSYNIISLQITDYAVLMDIGRRGQ